MIMSVRFLLAFVSSILFGASACVACSNTNEFYQEVSRAEIVIESTPIVYPEQLEADPSWVADIGGKSVKLLLGGKTPGTWLIRPSSHHKFNDNKVGCYYFTLSRMGKGAVVEHIPYLWNNGMVQRVKNSDGVLLVDKRFAAAAFTSFVINNGEDNRWKRVADTGDSILADDDDKNCTACTVRAPNVVFQPCKHKTFCERCLSNLAASKTVVPCPICRATITSADVTTAASASTSEPKSQ
jgi:hypothetical protein